MISLDFNEGVGPVLWVDTPEEFEALRRFFCPKVQTKVLQGGMQGDMRVSIMHKPIDYSKFTTEVLYRGEFR